MEDLQDYDIDLDDLVDVKYRDDPRYRDVKWTIFPDDNFRAYWEAIISVNLIYTALFIPYTVAFIENVGTALLVIGYISDALWLIDIVITFFIAYEDKEDNLVMNKKKIAINYLTGWFLIDVVSIFPFELIL